MSKSTTSAKPRPANPTRPGKPAPAPKPFAAGIEPDHTPRRAPDGTPIRQHSDADAAWYQNDLQQRMDSETRERESMADSRRFWAERRMDGYDNGYEADVAGLGYRRIS